MTVIPTDASTSLEEEEQQTIAILIIIMALHSWFEFDNYLVFGFKLSSSKAFFVYFYLLD